MKDVREAVAAALERSAVPELGDDGDLVGIGGTVRNLAKMDVRRTDHPLPLLHGYELLVENLEQLTEDLAGRTMKRRARLRGLNPDRADSIVGGALVVLAVMRHLGAKRVVVSSRGVREGLALGESASVPTPRQVRTISAATLAARFATWDGAAADRDRPRRAAIEALDPDVTPFVAELLEHAASLLDVGKAIDYYERFEHAAMIVTTADLAGFTHEGLGTLSAILRHAGGDTSFGPYARLIPAGDRPAVRRAAVALALAEELHRRIPPREPVSLRCSWHDRFEVEAPVPAPLHLRSLGDRFRSVFGVKLSVVPAPPPAAEDGDGTRLGTRAGRRTPQACAAGSVIRNVVPRPSSLSTSSCPRGSPPRVSRSRAPVRCHLSPGSVLGRPDRTARRSAGCLGRGSRSRYRCLAGSPPCRPNQPRPRPGPLRGCIGSRCR